MTSVPDEDRASPRQLVWTNGRRGKGRGSCAQSAPWSPPTTAGILSATVTSTAGFLNLISVVGLEAKIRCQRSILSNTWCPSLKKHAIKILCPGTEIKIIEIVANPSEELLSINRVKITSSDLYSLRI
ncbi:hypothetical protein L1887_23258 [Cichorium endivia]|nr:hypothetical protein L1887_23258 [Cichorium endivia]